MCRNKHLHQGNKMIDITKLDIDLSSIERILLGTDGSITSILEILFGEIHIKLLKQKYGKSSSKMQNIFKSNASLNKRQVMIYAHQTPLMYAKSFCDLSLLPNKAKEAIEIGKMPIGRVLDYFKIESRREILSINCKNMNKKYRTLFDCNGKILMRKYVIYHAQKPLFHIQEVFVRGALT